MVYVRHDSKHREAWAKHDKLEDETLVSNRCSKVNTNSRVRTSTNDTVCSILAQNRKTFKVYGEINNKVNMTDGKQASLKDLIGTPFISKQPFILFLPPL